MKKSMLVEANGGPLAVVVAAANVNDAELLAATLEAVVVERPAEVEGHLCLDKGYDTPTGHAAAACYGYVAHIRRLGEEKLDAEGVVRYPARRWVVERTFAWLSRCRGLLVRYERKAANYLGLLQWACALLWYRRIATLSQPSYVR
jgi:putative transposase